MCLRLVAAQKQPTPAATPITISPPRSTKPDPGGIATRPATAPDAAPTTEGFPLAIHSANIQPRAAAAVAICVPVMAMPARPFAATAEPALNPNQPTHSSEAPITAYARLCGAMLVSGWPLRLPSTSAHIRPAIPALICTTVPPAKSRTPACDAQPEGDQTQCAIGELTINDHTAMKMHIAENFMRSAKAPAISAGVMIAK